MYMYMYLHMYHMSCFFIIYYYMYMTQWRPFARTHLHSTVSFWNRLASDRSTAIVLLSRGPKLNFMSLVSDLLKS